MKTFIGMIAVLFIVTGYSNAEIAVGDTFVLWAGYSDITGMSGGRTDATEVLDSVTVKNDTVRYVFSIINTNTGGFFEMGGTMKPLVTSKSSKVVVFNKTPSNIISYSSRFNNVKWIIGNQSDFLFYPDLEKVAPYSSIPINSSGQSYLLNDYYTIRVSDTTGIKWMRDSTDDRSFLGKFIRFQSKFDTIGTRIPDSSMNFACGKSPEWRSTGGSLSGSNNPFNVLRLGISSSMYPLKNAVLTMGQGCYSNQITYYKPVQSVSIIVPMNGSIVRYGPNSSTYYNLLGQKMITFKNGISPMIFITKMNGYSKSKTVYELKTQLELEKK
jgi:hypothetical protein